MDVPRSWEAGDNAVLAAGVARYPGVAVLADWYTLSSGHPEWFTPDQVHLEPAGAQAMATLITSNAPERVRAPGPRVLRKGHAPIRTVCRTPVRRGTSGPVHGRGAPLRRHRSRGAGPLAGRHSANAVRVELPEPDHRAGLDRYDHAARQLERWQDDGILVARPAARRSTPTG